MCEIVNGREARTVDDLQLVRSCSSIFPICSCCLGQLLCDPSRALKSSSSCCIALAFVFVFLVRLLFCGEVP